MGLIVGEGAVALVRGEWFPCLVLSLPIREDIDMEGPGPVLEAKLDKSRVPG